MKIFVVEDETEICKELSVLLQKYGYAYESSTDFAHITDHILKAEADLVLLDINLPYQDGYTICHEIRKQCATVGYSDYRSDKQKYRL